MNGESEGKAYTYILRCSDGTLYTGWTTCPEKRLAVHNAGKGAKYTRGRRPVRLVYYETFATKEEAMSREYAIKRLTRAEKLRLIGSQSETTELIRKREPVGEGRADQKA